MPMILTPALVPRSFVGGSIGAAWTAAGDTPASELLAAADQALYQVKADRRGRRRIAG